MHLYCILEKALITFIYILSLTLYLSLILVLCILKVSLCTIFYHIKALYGKMFQNLSKSNKCNFLVIFQKKNIFNSLAFVAMHTCDLIYYVDAFMYDSYYTILNC